MKNMRIQLLQERIIIFLFSYRSQEKQNKKKSITEAGKITRSFAKIYSKLKN